MTVKMIDKCASEKDQQKVRIVTQKERLMLQKKSDRKGKKRVKAKILKKEETWKSLVFMESKGRCNSVKEVVMTIFIKF